jgi:hypothetical protein
MKRQLLIFLGSICVFMPLCALVLLGVWSLNTPAGCPTSRVLTLQRCPSEGPTILANALITVLIVYLIHFAALTMYRAWRRRAVRTTTAGEQSES